MTSKLLRYGKSFVTNLNDHAHSVFVTDLNPFLTQLQCEENQQSDYSFSLFHRQEN